MQLEKNSARVLGGNQKSWPLRLALEKDVAELEALIVISVRTLQAACYSPAQREAALGPVFGLDRQLIRDATYFVVEEQRRIVGCGGWSKRQSLYGGSSSRISEEPVLDPKCDPARVRAFFVHPDWARRGIGASILNACEEAILAADFYKAELVATLAGEPLYASFGYGVGERYELPLGRGLSLPVVRMTKRLTA